MSQTCAQVRSDPKYLCTGVSHLCTGRQPFPTCAQVRNQVFDLCTGLCTPVHTCAQVPVHLCTPARRCQTCAKVCAQVIFTKLRMILPNFHEISIISHISDVFRPPISCIYIYSKWCFSGCLGARRPLKTPSGSPPGGKPPRMQAL